MGVCRYNFIVEEEGPGGCVRLVDFEHAQDHDEELALAELESLPAELAKETGRGSSITTLVVQPQQLLHQRPGVQLYLISKCLSMQRCRGPAKPT